MTAQLPEQILYKGEQRCLYALPLESKSGFSEVAARFRSTGTFCHRSYVGFWAINQDGLYLVGLDAIWAKGGRVDMEALHPEAGWPIFADWFSGVLRIPEYEFFHGHHLGGMHDPDGHRELTVRAGRVLSDLNLPKSEAGVIWF